MASDGYFFVGDILGFGNIIRNLDDQAVSIRIQEWVDLVTRSTTAEGISEFQLISDTLFAAAPGSEQGLAQLVGLARRLLNEGVRMSLPIRGAITYGSYTWGRDLIYGKAVVEAHTLETEQNWIGTVCAPTLQHQSSLYGFGKLIVYSAPKKRGPIQNLSCVDWDIPPTKDLITLLAGRGLAKINEVFTHAQIL